MNFDEYATMESKRAADGLVDLISFPVFILTCYMIVAYCPTWFVVTFGIFVLARAAFYVIFIYRSYCKYFGHKWMFTNDQVKNSSLQGFNQCKRFGCGFITRTYGLGLTPEEENQLIANTFKIHLDQELSQK